MTLATRRLLAVVLSLVVITMVFASLDVWYSAGVWAQTAVRPDSAKWVWRLLAVAGVAAGQVVLALGVVPCVFRRGRGEVAYAIGATAVVLACGVSAGVLATQAW
ncbi:MAG: hypothetical protein AAGI46_06595 [Planctomycetota bacterium]